MCLGGRRLDLPDGGYLTGGIESGERYHVPGNMFWLRPKTFHNLLFDVYEAMRRRGFRAIVVLSGHWSIEHNVAAIRATGEEFRRAHPTTGWLLLTNQEVVPDRHYPVEHTAGGETSLLLAIHPNLIASTRRLSLTARCSLTTPINQDTWDGAARARTSTSASTQRLRTYRTIQKARRSSVGRALLETIVERVAARARTVLAETTSGDQ